MTPVDRLGNRGPKKGMNPGRALDLTPIKTSFRSSVNPLKTFLVFRNERRGARAVEARGRACPARSRLTLAHPAPGCPQPAMRLHR